MSSYQAINRLLRETNVVIGASETDTPITADFAVTPEDSKHIKVAVVATTVTSTTGINARLQDSYDGGTTWTDVASVEITAAGTFEIEHDVSEASTGMMWPLARVIVDSGVSDAATVTAVYVTTRY